MIAAGTQIPSLEEWLAEDDFPGMAIQTPAQTVARHRRAEQLKSQAVGSKRPVASGRAMHPQLRLRKNDTE